MSFVAILSTYNNAEWETMKAHTEELNSSSICFET